MMQFSQGGDPSPESWLEDSVDEEDPKAYKLYIEPHYVVSENLHQGVADSDDEGSADLRINPLQ